MRSFFETKYNLLQSFFLIEELLLNESFLLVNSIFMLKGKSDTKINKLNPEITECLNLLFMNELTLTFVLVP